MDFVFKLLHENTVWNTVVWLHLHDSDSLFHFFRCVWSDTWIPPFAATDWTCHIGDGVCHWFTYNVIGTVGGQFWI